MKSQISPESKDRPDRSTSVPNLTHPCSPGCGTRWTQLVYPQNLRSICPWDLRGLPLIVPKKRNFCSPFLMAKKNKIKFRTFLRWDEIPATFIIRRNYSSSDSWILKYTDFLLSYTSPVFGWPWGSNLYREGREEKESLADCWYSCKSSWH